MHPRLRHLFIGFAASAGVLLGFSVYTFVYARGYAYLTDDPRACVNCHVMRPQYDGWVKAPHRNVAACNDCHTPHNLLGKYAVKAKNGFWHSYYFTTQAFTEPIEITGTDRKVALGNCRRCHAEIVSAIDGVHGKDKALDCLRCHKGAGH